MPSAPNVIEDYDDVSTTTDQSPDTHLLPLSSPPPPLTMTTTGSARTRTARVAPRPLDFGGPRPGELDESMGVLRSASYARPPQPTEGARDGQQSGRGDGSSTPMSPALSLRMQQITRAVSPLTQHTQTSGSTTPRPILVDEVERVNMPRRERVRTSSQRSVVTLRSVQDQGQGRPVGSGGGGGITSGPIQSEEDRQVGQDSTSVRTETSDTMPSDAGAVPDGPRIVSPDRGMSKSESGGILASIAGPYYSDSTSFLPLPQTLDTETRQATISVRSSSLAKPDQSPGSIYDEHGEGFDGVAEEDDDDDDDGGRGREAKTPHRTDQQQQQPVMALEPAVEFFGTPNRPIWNEHSPERTRSDSIVSMVTDASLPMQQSESRTAFDDTETAVSPEDLGTVEIHLLDCGPEATIDLGVFRKDMTLLHKVRKHHSDLLELQSVIVLQSGLTIPPREAFGSLQPGVVHSRRTTVDLWFQMLQLQLHSQPDSHAMSALSSFLSSDILPESSNRPSPVEPDTSPHGPRSEALTSVQATRDRTLRPTQTSPYKEGFLAKRGKNFGGWKSRYFVLDGPILRYFEALGGSQLGSIKLPQAQLGSGYPSVSSGDKEVDGLQHAFLILEPKKRNNHSFVRHVLCASSDSERDDWVAALLYYVQLDESVLADTKELGKFERKGSKDGRKESRSSLKNLVISSPTVGVPYDAHTGPSTLGSLTGIGVGGGVGRSDSNDKFSAIGYGDTQPGRQPLFDPKTQVIQRATPGSVPPRTEEADNVPSVSISGPMNGAPIDNNTAWCATPMSNSFAVPPSPSYSQPEKKSKKKSFWSFGKSDHTNASATRDFASSRSASANDVSLNGPVGSSNSSGPGGVFGVQLVEAVQMSDQRGFNTGVPIVVSRCIDYLDLKRVEQEEGIYRLSGSNTTIRALKERFNNEIDVNLAGSGEFFDVHAIAGLLKLYLRELPASILTRELQLDFLDIIEMPEGLARMVTVRTLVHSLPRENFELLKILSRHLAVIVSNADINKMTLRNVGIVFSPTLNIPAGIFSLFIAEYDAIFGEREADRSNTLSPPPALASDSVSIRSTRSNNPRASVVLDAEQSYNLLQQQHRDYATHDDAGEHNPYGLSHFRT